VIETDSISGGRPLGTFIANPEAYIDGGKELIVEGVSRPVTEMGKEVARNTNWTLVGITGIGVLGALAAWRTWLKRPADIAGASGGKS